MFVHFVEYFTFLASHLSTSILPTRPLSAPQADPTSFGPKEAAGSRERSRPRRLGGRAPLGPATWPGRRAPEEDGNEPARAAKRSEIHGETVIKQVRVNNMNVEALVRSFHGGIYSSILGTKPCKNWVNRSKKVRVSNFISGWHFQGGKKLE